jgi:RND family efflux transporter MFP subunit
MVYPDGFTLVAQVCLTVIAGLIARSCLRPGYTGMPDRAEKSLMTLMKAQQPAHLLTRSALILYVLAVAGLVSQPVGAADAELAVAAVDYRPVTIEQVFDGTIEAVRRSTVSAQTAGEIIELPFDVNDYVPKDAVIVRFDDTRQKARLDKVSAAQTEARARLTESEKAFRREARLLEEDATSKAKFENAKANFMAARAKLELAEAAVAEAREELEYTVVRAPFSGIVVERFVEPGEQVQIGQALGTGLSFEQLRAVVEVPGRYINGIRQRRLARVLSPGGTGESVDAESLTVFPFANPTTHTFTVRLNLAEGEHGFYPGMLAKVAFDLGEKQELVVPSRAIVRRSEVTGVYVVKESGQVGLRQIRSGRALGDGQTVVLAGLEAGERVALDPVQAGIVLKRQLAEQGHE